MNFKNFYFENIISEDGKLLSKTFPNVISIEQKYISKTLQLLEKTLLKSLGLKTNDWKVLGSVGKKAAPSGDIDIAIDVKEIIKNKNVKSVNDVFPYIERIIKRKRLDFVYIRGLNIVSVSFPIVGVKNKFVQVDLMPTDNLDFTNWVYWSPKETETKYKKMGLYRTELLKAIADQIDRKVLKKFPDGQEKEINKFVLNSNLGFYRKTTSFMGKKGLPIKKGEILKRTKPIKDPQKIVKIILGKDATIEDTNSFESIYSIMKSKTFPYKNKVKDIKEKFNSVMIRKGLPIPEEFS